MLYFLFLSVVYCHSTPSQKNDREMQTPPWERTAGDGLPVFAPRRSSHKLKLMSSSCFANGWKRGMIGWEQREQREGWWERWRAVGGPYVLVTLKAECENYKEIHTHRKTSHTYKKKTEQATHKTQTPAPVPSEQLMFQWKVTNRDGDIRLRLKTLCWWCWIHLRLIWHHGENRNNTASTVTAVYRLLQHYSHVLSSC